MANVTAGRFPRFLVPGFIHTEKVSADHRGGRGALREEKEEGGKQVISGRRSIVNNVDT